MTQDPNFQHDCLFCFTTGVFPTQYCVFHCLSMCFTVSLVPGACPVCMKCALSFNVFLRSTPPVGLRNTRGTYRFRWHFSISGSEVVPSCLPLWAWGAKWRTQQNKHPVIVTTSGDVLVKIVQKVKAHFTHTGSGSGPIHYVLFLCSILCFLHAATVFVFHKITSTQRN